MSSRRVRIITSHLALRIFSRTLSTFDFESSPHSDGSKQTIFLGTSTGLFVQIRSTKLCLLMGTGFKLNERSFSTKFFPSTKCKLKLELFHSSRILPRPNKCGSNPTDVSAVKFSTIQSRGSIALASNQSIRVQPG